MHAVLYMYVDIPRPLCLIRSKKKRSFLNNESLGFKRCDRCFTIKQIVLYWAPRMVSLVRDLPSDVIGLSIVCDNITHNK